MSVPQKQYRVTFAAGIIVGAFICCVNAKEDQAPSPWPKNIVVLKSEKLVNLDTQNRSLPEIAADLSKQTGYSIRINPKMQETKKRFSLLTTKIPLSDVFRGISILSEGRWERSGRSYLLVPLSSGDAVSQGARVQALLEQVSDYLSTVDEKDPSLTENQRNNLVYFRRYTNEAPNIPLFAADANSAWIVRARPKSLSISYSLEEDNGYMKKGSWGNSFMGW